MSSNFFLLRPRLAELVYHLHSPFTTTLNLLGSDFGENHHCSWGKPSLQLGTLLESGNLKYQPVEEFEKKVVLKNFATLTVKQLYRSVFFNNAAGIRWNIENFVDFAKFLRAPLRKNLHTIASESAEKLGLLHCVKGVRIWRFSGPYFPAFGLEKLQIRTLFT